MGKHGDPREGYGLPAHRSQLPATRGGGGLVYVAEQTTYVRPDPELDLLSYWRMLVKHRWVILGVLAASLLVGALVTFLARPEYRATTTIQIEREAAKVVDVEGLEAVENAGNDRDFYQTQYELLKSRALAERVARALNLGQDPAIARLDEPAGVVEMVREKVRGAPARPTDPVARERAAVGDLMERLEIDPVRNSRLVRVSFESPDPELSARVANAVADAFIESTLARRFEATAYARKFLETRLAQVKQRLEQSERELVNYARSQGIVNIPTETGTGEGRSIDASSLVALNDALASARAERIRAEAQWRQAQASGGMTLPAVLQNSSVSVLRETRAKLSAEYQQKLSTFQPAYPEMVELRAQIAELDRQIATEVSNIRSSIRNNYEAARRQEAALAGQVSGLKSGVLDLQDRSIQYTILQREVDTNRSLYDGLLQRYKQIGVAGGVGTNNISVVDRAERPSSPSRPSKTLNLAIAAAIGLMLGLLIAFLLENIDETVTTPEDVEQKIGLNLFGSIPLLQKGQTIGEAMRDQRSAFAEAYYSAGTALSFAGEDGPPKVLLVTSTRQGEGKSTTAQTLAWNLARLGRRVLLVDADLRKPSLHRSLGVESSTGFATVLAGAVGLGETVRQISDLSLWFLPCGPVPNHPAELLSGARLKAMLDEAREQYDMVVLDGPPVLGLADATLLGGVADGVMLVVEAGKTRVGAARGAVRRLQAGRARVLGALLTKFDPRKVGYGARERYDYYYEYGPEEPKKLFARARLAS